MLDPNDIGGNALHQINVQICNGMDGGHRSCALSIGSNILFIKMAFHQHKISILKSIPQETFDQVSD